MSSPFLPEVADRYPAFPSERFPPESVLQSEKRNYLVDSWSQEVTELDFSLGI